MPVVLKIPQVQARPGRGASRRWRVGRGICRYLALLLHLPDVHGVDVVLVEVELRDHLIVPVDGGSHCGIHIDARYEFAIHVDDAGSALALDVELLLILLLINGVECRRELASGLLLLEFKVVLL